MMRNFSPKQKFFAVGQTLQGIFHFNEKESLYASVGYYSRGSFKNRYTATAKSVTTIPSSIVYDIEGKLKSNEISFGWRHFWLGTFNSEYNFNIYTQVGFGLMFARIENIYSTAIDTSLYDNSAAPLNGEGKFKRLTLDIGLGVEYHVGGSIYAYSDLRTWLPTTHYPSEYLHNNKNVPLPLIFSAGLRILFGTDDY